MLDPPARRGEFGESRTRRAAQPRVQNRNAIPYRYPEAREAGALTTYRHGLVKCAKAVSRVRFFDMYDSD